MGRILNRSKVKKVKDPIGFIKMLKTAFPIIYRVCPVYFTIQQLVSTLHGLSHAVVVTVTAIFFDSVLKVANGEKTVSDILIWFVIYSGVIIVVQILNGMHNYMYGVVARRVQGYTTVKIHEKSSKINPIMYENPKNLDDINKAFNGAGDIFSFCMTITTLLTFYLPYFIYMSIYLYEVNRFLPVAVFVAFMPSMLSMITNTKFMSSLEDEAAPIRRKLDYFSNAIVGIEHMKETRIYGLFNYFYGYFKDAIKRFNKKDSSARRKVEYINLGLNSVSLIAYGAVIFYILYLFINFNISAGAFAAVYSYMGLVFGIMNEIVTLHIGNMSKNYGTIRNYIRFMNLQEIGGAKGEMDENPQVELKNVSFSYPKADQETLVDISLKINPGETLAIVGQNGAGKTTLVRLITGIYKPVKGKVEIGGLDSAEIWSKSIYESVTGVFQKFQKYKMTLEDNVKIAHFDKEEPIDDYTSKIGIDINNSSAFPEGINTMLSQEFGGIDLSGGQWQRIALARGFYKDHKLVVLDEPTAAIDPLEECNIYNMFMEIARDKTAVIVTHRMGSVKLADRVVVLDNGRIDDIGTHDELMRREGLYYKMFTAQSSWYDKGSAAVPQ